MIVDAHAHIFDRVNGLIGRGWTKSISYGRAQCGNGEIIRVLPPLSRDTSFPPEVLLEYMDWAGVEKAVLLQGPYYGETNEYVYQAVKRWRNRFIGAAYLDPWKKGAKNTFRLLIDDMGFRIIKMELSEKCGYTGLYPDFKIDAPLIEWIWEEIEKRNLVIVLDLGPIGGKAYQTEAVKEVLNKYPDLKMVLTHLCYPPIKAQGDEKLNRLWQEQISLARRPNVWIDLAALPAHAHAAGEEYPYPGASRFICKAVELVGADKLLWGTDVPGLLTVATYSQLLTFISKHCNFLSKNDIAKILGKNAIQVYDSS